MSVAPDLLELRRVYRKYRRSARVDPADMDTLEYLTAGNNIIIYSKNGIIYAKSPY